MGKIKDWWNGKRKGRRGDGERRRVVDGDSADGVVVIGDEESLLPGEEEAGAEDANQQNTDERWTEVLPPPGHPMLGMEVLRIVGDVIADKMSLGLNEKWIREYKLVHGEHWSEPARVPQKVANLVHTHIQRTVNTLTDNNPTFNVNQMGDGGNDDVYTRLQLTAEFWWNETEQQSFFEQSVRNGETYGLTIEKMIFNPDIEYGIGDVETVIVDPFHFGIYPVKCAQVQKADCLLHYYPMSVREARRRWPHLAERIVGDGQFLEDLGSERREVAGGVNRDAKGNQGSITSIFTTVAGAMSKLYSSTSNSGNEGDDETLVVEAWCKDYSIGPDGLPLYKGFIRRVTACSAGMLIVDDRSNPSISEALPDDMAQLTYLYDKYPFNVANSVAEAGWFWGMSDLEQLENLQTEVNKTISQISYHKDKAVRPKVINPKDTGVPKEHFTNVIGVLEPTSSAVSQGIRYLEMTNNLRDLMETFNLYKELFFQVGGTFELDQAQAPGRNVIAYKAIAALLERAATMMRGKIRNYSRLVRDRGRMFLSHMMNFYTEDRWITYDESGETKSMQVRGTEMIVPSKLTVVSGSTMPQSKVQQREEALDLFKLNAIDRAELLEKLDWSGRSAVVQRMEKGATFDFIDRLAQMGAPPELTEVYGEIMSLPRDDFDKMLEAGEIPLIAPPQVDPKNTLLIERLSTEIAKLQADRDLIVAKIDDIHAEHQVKLAGIEYDRQKLEVERVKVLGMLKNQHDRQVSEDEARFAAADNKESSPLKEKRSMGLPAPGPERGLKSNNAEL